MLLFLIFLNELLEELQIGFAKTTVIGLVINNPVYTDDLCILPLTKPGLQAHFKVAYHYSTKW